MGKYAKGDLVQLVEDSDIAEAGGEVLTGNRLPQGIVGVVKSEPRSLTHIASGETVVGYFVSFPEAPADWFRVGKDLICPEDKLKPAEKREV